MTNQKSSRRTCKHCKAEIPVDSSVCPQCGKKQGPGICLTIIIVFIMITIFGSAFGLGPASESNDASATVAETQDQLTP